MRDFNSISTLIGPFVQVVRGTLTGCILLILKDNLLKEERAWLKLWIVFAGLGIICTPGPAPVSIEGIVYSQLPLEVHLKGAPEIFVQMLLFSVWVTGDFKWKISERMKTAVDAGLPVFVSEFGICDASGNGMINKAIVIVR